MLETKDWVFLSHPKEDFGNEDVKENPDSQSAKSAKLEGQHTENKPSKSMGF